MKICTRPENFGVIQDFLDSGGIHTYKCSNTDISAPTNLSNLNRL